MNWFKRVFDDEMAYRGGRGTQSWWMTTRGSLRRAYWVYLKLQRLV